MNEQSPAIGRSSRRLRYATMAMILLYELGVGFGVWLLLSGRRQEVALVQVHDSGLAPWPAAITLLAQGLLIGLALFRVVRLLARVEAGATFGVARELRGFALYLFLAVLATMLTPPLLPAALEGAAAGINFAFGSGEALMLLITGLLFLVARLLDEAQRLAEDHNQIV